MLIKEGQTNGQSSTSTASTTFDAIKATTASDALLNHFDNGHFGILAWPESCTHCFEPTGRQYAPG